MFSKAVFIFLAIGALSVNALATPVARSPVPEPACEFPGSFSITRYHNLTLVSFSYGCGMEENGSGKKSKNRQG